MSGFQGPRHFRTNSLQRPVQSGYELLAGDTSKLSYRTQQKRARVVVQFREVGALLVVHIFG